MKHLREKTKERKDKKLGLFDPKINEEAKGKNIEAVAKSRLHRQKFIQRYGFVPDSILVNDRRDKAIDLLVKERGYNQIANKKLKEHGISNKQLRSSLDAGFKGARKGALSRFPQNIGKLLRKIPRSINGVDCVEVLVINDGSTDNTVQVAKNAGADEIIGTDSIDNQVAKVSLAKAIADYLK